MLNHNSELKNGNIFIEFKNEQDNLPSKKLQTYAIDRQIGQGAFAIVYLATVQDTLEKVAIKKIPLDKKYKNREFQNHKFLGRHPNIVQMSQAFYVIGQNNNDIYLNLVLEYYPENLRQYMKEWRAQKKQIFNSHLKIIIFQMIRGVAFMHAKGLVHRDLKPQNILIDTHNFSVKICDLGSAKILQQGQGNVSYICSRYYRAPELIFGSTDYSFTIDTWSLGCIMAELILQEPLFPGESSVDQLVEIMKVLGTPTYDDIQSFNINHNQEFKFPQVKSHPWSKVLFKQLLNLHKKNYQIFLKYKPEASLVDLIKKMVVYNPNKRIGLLDALNHPYFDVLREQTFNEGQNFPDIWQLNQEEKDLYPLDFQKIFIPQWYQIKNY